MQGGKGREGPRVPPGSPRMDGSECAQSAGPRVDALYSFTDSRRFCSRYRTAKPW